MITAMTPTAIIIMAAAIVAVAAYGAYLVSLVDSDGARLARRDLPPSRHPDVFDARPDKYELFDPSTASTRLA